MKKVFLAIRIDNSDEIASYISEYQHNYSFIDAKWTDVEYLHLTLKYFGPTSEKRIKKLEKQLEKLFSSHVKFSFSIVKLGVFGSKYAPKVLWWGIKEEELMKELFGKIEESLKEIGIYSDRQNFVPHITLARIKKVNSKPSFQFLMNKHRNVGPMKVKVNEIVLLESRSVEGGVEYIELAKFELA